MAWRNVQLHPQKLIRAPVMHLQMFVIARDRPIISCHCILIQIYNEVYIVNYQVYVCD